MGEIFRFRVQNTLDDATGFQFQYITQIRTVTTLHDHEFCEIFLVAHGQAEHLLNGTVQPLAPGALMLIRPEDRHAYRPIAGESCGLFNLAFATHHLHAAARYLTDTDASALLNAPQPPALHLPAPELRAWTQRFRAMTTHTALPGTFPGLYARELLAQLVRLLLDARHTTAVHPHAPVWLEQLRRSMEDPGLFREGMPAMLTRCPYSKEHLYRQFRRYYGETPSAYLHRLRLNYAASLLTHTDTPITQIALEAGYENLSYFYSCFQKQFALTPRTYRLQTQRDAVEGRKG